MYIHTYIDDILKLERCCKKVIVEITSNFIFKNFENIFLNHIGG